MLEIILYARLTEYSPEILFLLRWQLVFKGAMSHTAHVRDEALHLENVRQLCQVLWVIQYQEFIVIYRSHPLTVRIVKR